MHRFQWPSGLRRSFAADRLLEFRVRIAPGLWIFVSCDFCVMSSRGHRDGPIPRPGESYGLRCVTVGDLGTVMIGRPGTALGCCHREIYMYVCMYTVRHQHLINFKTCDKHRAYCRVYIHADCRWQTLVLSSSNPAVFSLDRGYSYILAVVN
jgi:hypothetical protein